MGSLIEKETWKLIVREHDVQLCLVKHKQFATDCPVSNKERTFSTGTTALASIHRLPGCVHKGRATSEKNATEWQSWTHSPQKKCRGARRLILVQPDLFYSLIAQTGFCLRDEWGSVGRVSQTVSVWCVTVPLTSYSSSSPPASLFADPWQQNRAAPRDSKTFPAAQVHWRQVPTPLLSALSAPEVPALASHVSSAFQLHISSTKSSTYE